MGGILYSLAEKVTLIKQESIQSVDCSSVLLLPNRLDNTRPSNTIPLIFRLFQLCALYSG